MKAALACDGIDAQPKKFIIAQFDKFSTYGGYRKKRMFPQPHQLHGLAAQARYIEWKSEQQARDARAVSSVKSAHGRGHFAAEERRLKGFMRMMRATPHEVLTERPEEFTPEFLEHKHVWDLVEELYEQRVG